MYDKDKVLILSKNEENLNYLKDIYSNAEKMEFNILLCFHILKTSYILALYIRL